MKLRTQLLAGEQNKCTGTSLPDEQDSDNFTQEDDEVRLQRHLVHQLVEPSNQISNLDSISNAIPDRALSLNSEMAEGDFPFNSQESKLARISAQKTPPVLIPGVDYTPDHDGRHY